MIRDWSVDKIKQELWKIKYAATDPRMDGWTTFEYKKDLIMLKYHIDELLNECSTYSVEAEFINELEQEKTLKLLKKKHK
jgi:hypothetical protein